MTIKGGFDNFHRPIASVQLVDFYDVYRREWRSLAKPKILDCEIDTGYTGGLLLGRTDVLAFGITIDFNGNRTVRGYDNSSKPSNLAIVGIEWVNGSRIESIVDVVSEEWDVDADKRAKIQPLIGVRCLRNCRLFIDYIDLRVEISGS